MKLNRIEINNFAGISQADINLTTPVNVILGPNGAAKSSIRDAIELVVTGGLCVSRGIYKKNQAPQLTNRYTNGKMSVQLHTDEGIYERHVTTTGSAGNTPAIDPEIARIAINPQAVLTMKPEDRQRVFLLASSNNSDTEKKIEAHLKKAGFGADIITRCLEDLDDAQKWAVEQRRIAKRASEDYLNSVPSDIPQPVITVIDKKIDLSVINIEEYKKILSQRSDERDHCIADLGAANSELQQIVDEGIKPSKTFIDAIRAVEQQLRDMDLPEAEKDIKAAHFKLENCQTLERKRANVMAECQGQFNAVSNDIDRIDTLKNNEPCITCLQKITTKIKEAALNGLKAKKEKAANEFTLAQKDHLDAAKQVVIAKRQLEQLQQQLTEQTEKKYSLENQLKELKTINAKVGRRVQLTKNIPELEKRQADIDSRIDALITIIEAWVEYNTYHHMQTQADDHIKTHKDIIINMNTLDELLKADGAVRKIANEQLEQAGFDKNLQQTWGMESLKLEADGTITLNGAPIEGACYTEIYRAGVLLAELLSRELGLDFLILDDVDHLKKPLRDALYACLRDWAMKFKSIILLSAVDEKPKLISNDIMCFHWVENGVCETLGQLAEAV